MSKILEKIKESFTKETLYNTYKKIKKVLQEPITYTHNFGSLVVGIVGFFFILFGLVVFCASWLEIVKFLINPDHNLLPFIDPNNNLLPFIDPQDNLISLFVTIAEYYLIAITFTFVGRSIIAIVQSTTTKTDDVGKLKEHLLAMVVSISGVAFINMILECETPANLNVNILFAGLAIASVTISLGFYIFLTREKRGVEETREEAEKKKKEEKSLAEAKLDKPPEPDKEEEFGGPPKEEK